MSHLDITDRYQGKGGSDGKTPFGYCGIADRGGQFFEWRATLPETLSSIEDDETDPPQNWPQRAYQEVRGFIRRTWASGWRAE